MEPNRYNRCKDKKIPKHRPIYLYIWSREYYVEKKSKEIENNKCCCPNCCKHKIDHSDQ